MTNKSHNSGSVRRNKDSLNMIGSGANGVDGIVTVGHPFAKSIASGGCVVGGVGHGALSDQSGIHYDGPLSA